MSKQLTLGSEIPDFKPVEFDGTRLDKEKQHSLIFKTKRERDKAYSLLKQEGFDCKKN